MFAGESLISIFFLYLNFAIIIAIAVYIFKRYLLVGIKSAMAAQEAEQESLMLHKSVLAAKQDALKEKEVSQEQMYVDLLRKVKAWRSLFEATVREREQERLNVQERLERKTKRVIQEYMLHSVEQRVIPDVLVRVRHNLGATFRSEQKGQDFLAQIVNHMNDKEAR